MSPEEALALSGGHPLENEVARVVELPERERAAAFVELRIEHPGDADLLRTWERALSLTPSADPSRAAVDVLPGDDLTPRSIGPYRVLSQLGEGGMGTVYLAEQREPVHRRIALKVIRMGLDSGQTRARFNLERQALALMNHSAIARVYDVGVTDAGQPFLAMEFVSGVPLDIYCDRHHLSVRERLKLMQHVCAGVQHAHQKGVVHRDLKPANVLVAEESGKPMPKIIDFGLARSTDCNMAGQTLFTQEHALLGTPEYMAPEQADPSLGDVDTRTDVYALGVMLYQILVGELPFPSARLRQVGLAEACRILCEEEPPRPSARFLQAPDRAEIARIRNTSSPALTRRLRGDLDWIVMRAIEKERHRRYETANGLAKDIERHLTHEPVSAGPPSTTYRIRKLIQRKRGQCVAAAASLIALIAGLIASVHFGYVAVEQRELAEVAARQQETEARKSARLARQTEALARAERDARADAEDNLKRYELLRFRTQLDTALEDAAGLHPAWPDRTAEIGEWVRTQGEPLVAALDVVREERDALRDRALPATDSDQSEERRFRTKSVEPKRQILESLRRAHEVRSGLHQIGRTSLPPRDAARSARALNELAWPLVTWQPQEREWGDEERGLELARGAWDKVLRGDRSIDASAVADTLAWASFAVGLDAEARSAMREALLRAADDERAGVVARAEMLERMIAQVSGPGWEALEAALVTEVGVLEDRATDRRVWQFADDADAFLHRTLVDLVDALIEFGGPRGELAWMKKQLQWSEHVERLSIEEHAAEWADAIEEIARSDRYDGLVLEPQLGLVPIGENPRSGLWEFHHLRSAADQTVSPRRGSDGFVHVDDTDGIIFVLLPAASFVRGAQADDPSAPSYDALADPDERPTRREVTAFFLAAHEVTQAQWARLSNGNRPSYHRSGTRYATPDGSVALTDRNPVESVTWTEAVRVLRQHGLRLPVETEWEYAARAGTSTPWWPGETPAMLEGSANVADATAEIQSGWDVEPWSDGHILHAPVGSFRPNAWGFCDIHGNVSEWCADQYGREDRVHRGGSYDFPATMARSAVRYRAAPSSSETNRGVRAARAILGR